MSGRAAGAIRRDERRLLPERSRVISQLFVPGQEVFDHHDSRVAAVLTRLLALSEDEVEVALGDVLARFGTRHRDLRAVIERHAGAVVDRLPTGSVPPGPLRALIGATFTSEYALEGAAICNPSVVAHPDQGETPAGSLRVVMSLRAIGEGHRSAIEFREGTIDAGGRLKLETPAAFASTGTWEPAELHGAVLRAELRRLDQGTENADYVLDALGERFSAVDLERELAHLHANLATRRHGARTAGLLRAVAERSYGTRFSSSTPVSERVLVPRMAAESHGMEDARFLRFVDDDRSVTYYGTYTAYDGARISQQLLETADFAGFTSSPVAGDAAANKGLALFPRRIGGRFAALSRWDRETNGVAFSDDPRLWRHAVAFQTPQRGWEILQLGNCGAPIETERGWLVLTHGVGPMRTYGIGAVLLDLDDPTQVLGQLAGPLLAPDTSEQDGYVPNVVYSCGAIVHAGNLVIPYGIGDAAIGVATVALSDVLEDLSVTTKEQSHA